MAVANDGFVYVCNREGSKIQVYDKMGKLSNTLEFPWKPDTPPADGKPKESGGAVVAVSYTHLWQLHHLQGREEVVPGLLEGR